jgi:hypothetical protein
MPDIARPTSIQGWNQYEYFELQLVATGMAGGLSGAPPDPTAVDIFVATVATTAALPASTYANGTAGVGATITGNANGALSVDSRAVIAGDIVLVKNQATQAQNGVYTVTAPGDAGTPFVLTRHASFDSVAEMKGFVRVAQGTANTGSFWAFPPALTAIGTEPIAITAWLNRWQITPLPAGLSFNPAIGRIFGAAETPGVRQVSVLASGDNGVSWSPPMVFALGIKTASGDLHPGPSLTVDVQTGALTVSGGTLTLNEGDDAIMSVRFVASGTIVDRGTLASLQIGIVQDETDGLLQIGGGAAGDFMPSPDSSRPVIAKVGSGSTTRYLASMRLIDPALVAKLDEVLRPRNTRVTARVRVEWGEPNALPVGRATTTRSSQSADVVIFRDQIRA